MESGEIEALVECLVANPHDTDALARAHQHGETDPQGYAYLLEQVGTRTEDPSYASHWLSEAANIWSVTIGDAHRAARVLMIAVDRDPTQPLAADRLAQLYRDKGDAKALVAMLDRRVRLLTPMLSGNPAAAESLRGLLATLHEELGKLWNEPPLEQPRKAIDHYKRSIEYDPTSAFAIFSVREIYKSLQQWDEALALYGMELAVERDPERRLMLARDEAATRRLAGDLAGVTGVLRGALEELRRSGGDDPALAQEVAGSVLDRAEAGLPVDDAERTYAANLLAGLAESFDGEHGLAYAAGALDLVHGHDRAMQLYAHYAAAVGADADAVSLRYHAYVEANPSGPMARDGRVHLSAGYEALGQLAQALQVLEPLKGQDPDIDERIAVLRRQVKTLAIQTPVAGIVVTRSPDEGVPAAADTDEVADVSRPHDGRGAKESSLQAARDCAAKADKAGALERYLEVLARDPVEPEALSWVEDALRAKRDYAKLRDVLWASARAMDTHDSLDGRKLRLREIAGLSESNLKDIDGAIQAWRQLVSLDRGDEASRQALTRALEKAQRWDDLANLYEQEASTSSDTDAKIQLEKKLAALHEQKRSDPLAAAEAWARIATLTPEDDRALQTAAELFEKAGRPELAAAAIEEQVESVADVPARAALLERLGRLLSREGGDMAAAGRAYQRAAEVESTLPRWASAERLFAASQAWPLAAGAATRIAELLPADGEKAEAFARASQYLKDADDEPGATAHLERANALAPGNDTYAVALIDRYRASRDTAKLVQFLVARGESHADPQLRVAALREAAKLSEATLLGDADAPRALWRKVLDAGDDAEALEHLIGIAESRGELDDAAALLRRLGAIAETKEEKTTVAVREADLLARRPETVGAAIERYEWLLSTLDPTRRSALRAIADLELKRGAPKAAASALERELALAPVTDAPARREIGARLVESYEAAGDDAGTFGALQGLRAADPDDFDTLNRLVAFAEKLERWDALGELLAVQIEVEGDEIEISALTRRRAALLADKLGRGDEALAALQELADGGDKTARDDYVALGDRLGWRGIVATKLVEWWFPEAPSDARTRALTGAFERFAVVGRDADAVRIGVEILRVARDVALAEKIEELAVKTSDDVGLSAAQEILGLELVGAARAAELVRQAEMRVRAKMAWAESVQHGETGLGGLTHDEVQVLLSRLAALIPTTSDVIDLYERQVSRSRGAEAREKALIRAAQVAGDRGDAKRSRTFFDLALSGTPSEATLDALTRAANEGENPDVLRRTLAEALANSGGGVRDGGRSRANFLRRAAAIAHRDLHDVDQAFAWLSEALVAHADATTLDALDALAAEVQAPRRVDDVITHVLTEVFDGPLVRLLLARRAKVRKEQLDDRSGAAADLKKLHDLSPTDEAVMTELAALLTEQGDHRSMVQLYEDQILRSKDQAVRAELGRKVAQIWESELGDAREAADAWRRVLRLKPGDEEATQGLDRSKSNMLRKSPAAAPATPARTSIVPAARASVAPPAAPRTAPPPAASAATTPTAPPVSASGSAPGSAPKVVPSPPPTPLAGEILIPDDDPSVQDVDDSELDLGAPEDTHVGALPELEQLLGSTDPFADANNTHTSIDVRLPLAAARALDEPRRATPPPPPPPKSSTPSASSSPRQVPESRGSMPPPLPGAPPYEHNDPPTSPGRRLDASASPPRTPTTDRALAMTDENAPIDLTNSLPDMTPHGGIPPEVMSATELTLDDEEDDERGDVLVVDEFVADADDEFEDVAEPSKPPGPLPQ